MLSCPDPSSVPNFPQQVSEGYAYPPPEAIYAQSFLCLSLGTDRRIHLILHTHASHADPENISTVASLLMTDRVYVFDNSLPSRYVMCTFPRNCLLSSASLAYTPRCRTSLPVTMSTVYVPPARFVHD